MPYDYYSKTHTNPGSQTTVAIHPPPRQEAHYFIMPQSPLTEANDSDASDIEEEEDSEDEEEEEEEEEEDDEEEEEEEGEVKKTRAKKWGGVEKKLFKTLVKSGELKIDGGTKHREYIRSTYWPNRKPETFRRNWLASTAEFRVAKFKDGARAISAGKGEKIASEFVCCFAASCLTAL